MTTIKHLASRNGRKVLRPIFYKYGRRKNLRMSRNAHIDNQLFQISEISIPNVCLISRYVLMKNHLELPYVEILIICKLTYM